MVVTDNPGPRGSSRKRNTRESGSLRSRPGKPTAQRPKNQLGFPARAGTIGIKKTPESKEIGTKTRVAEEGHRTHAPALNMGRKKYLLATRSTGPHRMGHLGNRMVQDHKPSNSPWCSYWA